MTRGEGKLILLDTDQTAGLGVLVVGVLTSQTVEPALYGDQLAAELSEGSRDVPVVFSAHLNVTQFPGLLDLQTIPWTPGLSCRRSSSPCWRCPA